VSPAGARPDVYDFDERAAVAIYDGGIPEAYADAFAQLQIAQPIGVPHPQWLRAIDDAGRFLDQWGNVAAQLQWSAEDIFKKPAALTVKTPPLDLGTFGLCGSSTVKMWSRSMPTPPRSATGGYFVIHLINQQASRGGLMTSRIRGGDAARAAVATTERLPVPLQATDLVGPFQPLPEGNPAHEAPRVRKPSARHDVIHAPTTDLDTHRAILRITFGTLSEEFADPMMGKVISGLRPNSYDLLEEATLNAALATIASLQPESEMDALMCVQAVIAGFSALRMLELSQRHWARRTSRSTADTPTN